MPAPGALPPRSAARAPRVVMLSQDFPPALGGAQTYAAELARHLAPRCARLAVIAPSHAEAAAFDAAAPYEVVRVGSSDGLPIAGLRALAGLARPEPFDVAFAVQWQSSLPALAGRRLGWVRRVCTAAHGRDLLMRPGPGPDGTVVGFAYHQIRKLAVRSADALFPVSRYTAGLLRDLGADPSRVQVLFNGADAERFAPGCDGGVRERLRLGRRPVLLSVCRLVRRKGIDTVLHALPAVLAAHPDAVYVVAGDGPDRARLEALAARLGVERSVRFLGAVGDDALPDLYRACDVFVLPARAERHNVEGFGIVFLEANACGKPVVGARSGGVPDAIRDGETGLLVPPDAPAALAEALGALLADPARAARLGAAGRRRVVEEATWAHLADRLFERLVDTRDA